MKDYLFVARQLILFCLTLSSLNNTAVADDRQVIDYYYDLSGNLVEKNTNVTLNSLAPSVSAINPTVVRRNTSTAVTVDGTDLKNVQLATDDAGLIVSNVSSTNTQLTFDLNVSNDVPLGPHTLLLSTLSGQVSHIVDVFPQLPQMVIRPTPLALAVGRATEVVFGISSTDVVEHQITVSVADPSIISVDATNFTIVAGERFPSSFLNVSGLNLGSTTLTFSSLALGDQVFTVVVGTPGQPSVGTQVRVRSDLLGMVLPTNSPDIKQVGPISSSLSVFLTPVIPPIDINPRLQLSSLLNIVFGSAFTSVLPKVVAADSNAVLTISGHGLSAVIDITITPSDGITVGAVQVNTAGTELTASVAVAQDVSLSVRSLRLLTSSAEIKPGQPELRQLYVGGQNPVIKTVTPVVVSRLSTQTLSVTGENFDGDVQVKLTPPGGVNIGSLITVNGDHTALSVDLNVSESAPLGPRVVSVETLNGVTTSVSLPTNTLTIANAIISETPVRSPLLGVLLEANGTESKTITLLSPELAVIRGTGITAVQPLSSIIDRSITLTVEGSALNGVTEVVLEPAQGVTVGVPQIASDGLSLTVDLVIAADALTTVRQLKIISGGTDLPFVKPEISRFEILGPVPKIGYISPNFIVAGSTSEISIHGEAFTAVDSVRVEPPLGMTLSVPQVNTDNTVVTIQITANQGVQRGVRTLIVRTASGESSVTPSASNQLNIVDTEVVSINNSLVSPLLGIQKGDDSANTLTQDLIITSDLLGIFIPEPEITVTQSLFTNSLSVVKGGYVGSISPKALQPGLTSSIVISGVGMQDVSTIEILPGEGVTVQSPLIINAGATKITADVTVASNAEKTHRQIIIHQNGNTTSRLAFVKPEFAAIVIAGGLPAIASISPVLQVANSQFELLIRGQDLQEVTAVNAFTGSAVLEPLIVFGTPVINVDGTELRVTVVVDRLVPSGAKSIVLTVPIGQTSLVPASENTLTIDTNTN